MVQGTALTAARPEMVDPVVVFETTVLPHPNLVAAQAAIARLHSRCQPPGSRPLKARALLIVGAPGAGKTTALEDYQRAYPDVALENTGKGIVSVPTDALRDADRRPIVYVEAPKKTTQRALVTALLGAFGYKAADHWDTNDIIRKIEFYADQMGTEMIFIDEGHHMVSSTKPEQTEDVAEFIKSLLNRTKRQIVIAGLPALLQITCYRQLHRRLQPSMILAPYNWSTRSGRFHFSVLLATFEKVLELPEPSGLAKSDFAKRFYVATGGEIGIVSKYLSEALSRAKAGSLRFISKELMAEVHDGWHQTYEPDDVLDFDAVLDDGVGTGQAAGSRPADNPFLCDDARLKSIWIQQQAARDAALAALRVGSDGSRVTTLKATGRAAFTPFTRS
ncbi:TniB family NTP-binding protein [Azospirillum sp. YIM DDC1]|uniref:TniB family NTP-binding protein n=1 Tax=Azospirillum aestuarii TaxID=2802052 RepID=A0ABS1I7J4_9PROT|nr:TniB family NTP-binding protein [Azospirillum aestuarii]MBK4723033.1 TniB family NTP-binding protein [Azospirillum aestuarii]